MKSKKISLKNSLLKMTEVFLIAIMIATIGNPKPIEAAEQDVTEYKFFVIKKNWESDLDSERPTSVSVHVESTDGSYNENVELLASEGWEKDMILRHKDDAGKEIIYMVYENESDGLEKYELSNPTTNRIIISEENNNCIIIEDNLSRSVVNQPYDLIKDTDEFYDAPFGNIRIDTRLLLEEATIEFLDENGNEYENSPFSYSTTTPKYANPFDKNDPNATNVVPRILYTGSLVGQQSKPIDGSIVLTWSKKAVNFVTGETYDVQITVDNISIYSEVDATNKTISIMSNVNNLLEMESFVTTFGSLYENVVGVAADIEIRLLGAPAHSYAQMYVTDLDVGDYATGYHKGYPSESNPEPFVTHNVNDPYVEAVELKRGVASSIYIVGNSRLITNDDKKNRYLDGNGSVDVNDVRNSLKVLVEVGDTANCYKYRWTGSKCETAIITLGTVPEEDTYTNIITNTSSLYRVQYFFQNDDGSYNEKPDVPKTEEDIPATLVMVKPGTEVSVENNAEKDPLKVDSTKTNYVLDSDTTDVAGIKTTSSSETTVLNVYFKRDCVVIYHDNFKDELWNPADQTYNNLNLNDETPVYEDGEITKIPVNPGYAFKGWSEIDYDKWVEDGTDDGPIFEPFGDVEPERINKPVTHYLAHWEALPNKYIVHYFYEVNGVYPSQDNPDYISEVRTDKKTDEVATITDQDKIPNPEKHNYYLNNGMTSEWSKTVDGDGSTILRVYFKQEKETIRIPVTGIK